MNDIVERPLWDFASALYAEPSIQELCLQLQDQHNANVNLILWCCWLESEGKPLGADSLIRAEELVLPLDQSLIVPLRKLRSEVVNTALTRVQQSVIKKQLLSAELTAEKVQLQRLQDLTNKLEPLSNTSKQALTLNYYLSSLEIYDLSLKDRFMAAISKV